MEKNEKTIEELCKQDLKKLAKKYSKTKEELKDFEKNAESFDKILKKTLSEKEMQDVIKNNICFAAVGGVNKRTGVKTIMFKFGEREEIKNDLVDMLFQEKVGKDLDNLIGKLKEEHAELKDLVSRKTDIVGRA